MRVMLELLKDQPPLFKEGKAIVQTKTETPRNKSRTPLHFNGVALAPRILQIRIIIMHHMQYLFSLAHLCYQREHHSPVRAPHLPYQHTWGVWNQ